MVKSTASSDSLFIDILLDVPEKAAQALDLLHATFQTACSIAAGPARKLNNFSRVPLHHVVYYKIRKSKATRSLSSQMACNAIQAVCHAYLALPMAERAKYLADPDYPMSWDNLPIEKQTIKIRQGQFVITTPGNVKISVPVPEDLLDVLESRAIYKGQLCRVAEGWNLQAETRPLLVSGEATTSKPIPADILAVLADRAIAAGALYFVDPRWHLQDASHVAAVPAESGTSTATVAA